MPLLVLDRDGVINHDSDDYIRSLDDWVPIEGSIEAIADFSRAGYQVAIASNQSGLARGYFDQAQLNAIHSKLQAMVGDCGGTIDGIFYCPHLPQDACNCRKPRTGLLRQIEQSLKVSAGGAPFVGDSLKDLQAARAHGCQPILVRTGKGEATLAQLTGANPDIDHPGDIPVFANLADVAATLLS